MPGYYMDTSYFIYVLPAVIIALLAQWKVKSTYARYSQVENDSGLTGAQVARQILDKNNLHHVRIEMTRGELSDHFDPRSNVVRLSPHVYQGNSVSSMSIAAHECGHAIQYAEDYTPLKIRSAMVPILNFGSNFVWIFIIIGALISPVFINLAIAIFVGTLLFQIATLPVEFNASSRALVQLEPIASQYEVEGSKKVLGAAALTYVAATLVALGELLRILSIFGTRNDNNN